jgi:hypothetical protein
MTPAFRGCAGALSKLPLGGDFDLKAGIDATLPVLPAPKRPQKEIHSHVVTSALVQGPDLFHDHPGAGSGTAISASPVTAKNGPATNTF